MAKDYVFKLVGEDALSPTLKNIQQNLDKLDESARGLKSADNVFDSISDSLTKLNDKAVKPTQAVKNLQIAMARLQLEGQKNSALYISLAQQAGQYKDALEDAASSIKAFTTDTQGFEAATQGMQVMAGSIASVTGVMTMFGSESKKVMEIQKQLQATIALVNGATAIANALQKDSTLRATLRGIAEKAKLAAIKANTVEETKNTVATAANTVAEKVNSAEKVKDTVITWNMNSAIAVTKVLMGDWTTIIMAVATALGIAGTAMSIFGDKTDEQNKKIEEQKQRQEDYARTAGQAFGDLMTKYQQLKKEWERLGDSHKAKAKWIDDNKSKLKELTSAVNDVKSAEDFFGKNTDKVVESFRLRAKAAAAAALATSEYQKMLQAQLKSTTKEAYEGIYVSADMAKKLPQSVLDKAEKVYGGNGEQYSATSSYMQNAYGGGNTTRRVVGYNLKNITEAEAAQLQAAGLVSRKFSKEAEESKKRAEQYINMMGEYDKQSQDINPFGGGNDKNNTTTNKPTSATTYYQKLKDNVAKAWKDLENLGPIDPVDPEAAKRLEELKDKLKAAQKAQEDYEILIGKKPKPTYYEQLKTDIQNLEKELKGLDFSNPEAERDLMYILQELAAKQYELKDFEIKVGIKQPDPVEIKPDEGSVAALEQKISDITSQLSNSALTVEARAELITTQAELQSQIDRIEHGDITIKAVVEPEFSQFKGDMADRIMSYRNAEDYLSKQQEYYDMGLISKQQFKEDIAYVNSELSKLGLKPIKIEFETGFDKLKEGFDQFEGWVGSVDSVYNSIDSLGKALEDGADQWKIFVGVIQVAGSILGAVGDTIEGVTSLIELMTSAKVAETAVTESANAAKEATTAVDLTEKTAEVAANKAVEASVLDLAAANIYLAHSMIPWIGVAVASSQITAMMAAMTAQHTATKALQVFAEGGVVGGSSQEHLVFAHRGEMILNEGQQKNLFTLLNRSYAGNMLTNGQVIGRIKGTDIELVMSNVGKTKAHSGLYLNIS